MSEPIDLEMMRKRWGSWSQVQDLIDELEQARAALAAAEERARAAELSRETVIATELERDAERDHSLSMETLVGSLRTQLALSHGWAERADQERERLAARVVTLTAARDAWKDSYLDIDMVACNQRQADRIVALKDQRFALKRAVVAMRSRWMGAGLEGMRECKAEMLALAAALGDEHLSRMEAVEGGQSERDRYIRTARQRGALKKALSQMASGRDWERENGATNVAYYRGRCLALLKEKYALKSLVHRLEGDNNAMARQVDALKEQLASKTVAHALPAITRPDLVIEEGGE